MSDGPGIVTGTDGSASAGAAVRQAAELAAASGVRAAPRQRHPAGRPPGEAVRATLEARASRARGPRRSRSTCTRSPATPAEALCAVAARVGAELIVVGNKGIDARLGRGGRRSPSRCGGGAPCPVLVVDTEPYWHAGRRRGQAARRGRIPREWQILLVTTVAVFMAFLDVTIVNVAFPSIAADFPEASLSELSWVLNAYNIVFAARSCRPAGSPTGSASGGCSSAASGCSSRARCCAGSRPTPALLIAARVVQAVGAAALIPTSLALVLPEFPPERRAVATSVWAAAGAVAAATGPSLGGVLVDAGGWRWAFFVNLVVALGVLPGAAAARRPRGPGQRRPARPARRRAARRRRRRASRSASSRRPTGAGPTSACSACWLAVGARAGRARRAARAGTRRRCSSRRCCGSARSRSATRRCSLLSIGFYALLLANVLFLTQVWGYSVLEAGFGVTPGPLAAAVAAVIGGQLTRAARAARRARARRARRRRRAACSTASLTGVEPAYVSDWLPVAARSRAPRSASRSPRSRPRR